MIPGDLVTITRYHGVMTGTVLAVNPGHITVSMNGARKIIDTTRRQVRVVK